VFLNATLHHYLQSFCSVFSIQQASNFSKSNKNFNVICIAVNLNNILGSLNVKKSLFLLLIGWCRYCRGAVLSLQPTVVCRNRVIYVKCSEKAEYYLFNL
jgi:hypothetical protein